MNEPKIELILVKVSLYGYTIFKGTYCFKYSSRPFIRKAMKDGSKRSPKNFLGGSAGGFL